MKKLLYLLYFLPTISQAQQWFASDYRWIFGVSGGFAGINEQMEMTADIDTVIHGRNCRKWVFNSTGYHAPPARFTISDGPRAYVYSERVDSFVLMYDFSLPVGTIVDMPDHFSTFSYRIDSEDVVQAGDFQLKRQRVTHYFNGQPGQWQFDILENIGMVGQPFDSPYPDCSFAILPDVECGSVADGIDFKFQCFSSMSGSFHPYADQCSVLSNSDCGRPTVSLLPNPTDGFVQIQVKNSNCFLQAVTLYDVQGRRVFFRNDGQRLLSLPFLSPGVYFLDMQFDNGYRLMQKLIKK